jgi:MYXO-CTERM domain-containing protein
MKLAQYVTMGALALAASSAFAVVPSSIEVLNTQVVLDIPLTNVLGMATSPSFTLSGPSQTLSLSAKSDLTLFDVVFSKLDPVTGFSEQIVGTGTQAADFKSLQYTYSNLGAGTYSFDVLGHTGAQVSLSASVTPVPEAHTTALFAAGALAAVVAARRRRA